MNETPSLPRWYALHVHTRSEKMAAAGLDARVEQVFCPVRVERRAWSDRIQRVEVPLFPGYLFVRTTLTPQQRVALLKVAHVVDVVGRKAGKAEIASAIPDVEMASLINLVAAQRALDPVDVLVPGVCVVIGQGPLRGVQGVVERGADGFRRLVVQVALLGRGVRTVLSADDVLVEKHAA